MNNAEKQATLKINLSKPGKAVSPMLYGIFFEDINRAADGGLYGNLIANGSFDYGADEPGRDMRFADWAAAGDAEITIKRSRPVNKINPNYINIKSASSGGIRNLGFGCDGFGVRRDENYRISFKARAIDVTVLSFRICADGRAIAEASAMVSGTRSPPSAIRTMTKLPALRLRAISGASILKRNTFSENCFLSVIVNMVRMCLEFWFLWEATASVGSKLAYAK